MKKYFFDIKVTSWAIAILFFIASCRSFQVISFEQFQDFQAHASIDTGKIRWDGFFNNIRESTASREFVKGLDTNARSNAFARGSIGKNIYAPELFFANGIYYTGYAWNDTARIVKNFSDRPSRMEGRGVLSIHGDTITVLCYEFFMTWHFWPRSENLIVTYEGKIINDTTIINWRRIPPHPALDFNHDDTIPTTLQFVRFSQKNLIDSNYVFINSRR
jgi:hypothetical protein